MLNKEDHKLKGKKWSWWYPLSTYLCSIPERLSNGDHARIQEFSSGGSRPKGHLTEKKLWQLFIVLNLLSKVLEEVQHFPRVQLFPGGGVGGVQMLITIEIYRNCDFQGVWTRYPPSGSAHGHHKLKGKLIMVISPVKILMHFTWEAKLNLS